MVKNKFLILFLVGSFILTFRAEAQSLSHQVIVPAADTYVNSGYVISQTVGEAAVMLLCGEECDLSQGFQQPAIKASLIEKPQGTGVNAYPNPVTSELKVLLFGETASRYRITIYRFNGTIVYTYDIEYTDRYHVEEVVDMRNFSKGLYLVRVISSDGIIDRVFKIEKM